MFTLIKMTMQLDDNQIIEFDFSNTDSPIVSSSFPLTPQEEMDILFKAGLFVGGGYAVLEK